MTAAGVNRAPPMDRYTFGHMEYLDLGEAVGTGQLCADTRILQIETGHGKKAIVIFVPVPLLQGWHRSQQR